MSSWIAQPKGSRVCGQIAVAVVADIPLIESIRLFGHESGTNTRIVARVLRSLGFSCPDRLVRLAQPPTLGLGKLRAEYGSGWHWVVFDGPKVWDGVYGDMHGNVQWPEHLRVTSYLPLDKPGKPS